MQCGVETLCVVCYSVLQCVVETLCVVCCVLCVAVCCGAVTNNYLPPPHYLHFKPQCGAACLNI